MTIEIEVLEDEVSLCINNKFDLLVEIKEDKFIYTGFSKINDPDLEKTLKTVCRELLNTI